MGMIKFADGTKLPLHNIDSTDTQLTFSVLDDYRDGLEDIVKDTSKTSVIRLVSVNEETQDEIVLKGYAGYTKPVSITTEYEGLTTKIDYETIDATTESGFAEEKHDITTVVLKKLTKIESAITELQESQAEQDETIAELMYGGEE